MDGYIKNTKQEWRRKLIIRKLYDASGGILDGKTEEIDGEMFGIPIKVYNVGIAKFLCER